MTASARKRLASFEKLSPSEQHQVAAEIVRRSVLGGDVSEEALTELPTEMFRNYDAEESAGKVG
jgi:hypothetical protein